MSMLINTNDKVNMRQRIPLYIAGYAACMMGLAAMNTITTGGLFSFLAFLFMTAGFYISWISRDRSLIRSENQAMLMIVVAFMVSTAIGLSAFRYHFFAQEALSRGDVSVEMALAWLTWFMALFSFCLMNDLSVSFLCVPSLSLIGLVATYQPTGEILTYFIIFLLLACFIQVQEHTLSEQKKITYRTRPAKSHLMLAGGITLLAIIAGIISGKGIFPALNMAFSENGIGGNISGYIEQFSVQHFIPVATGPAPTSDQEVMTVECKDSYLWCGQTFNIYTGHGWTSSLGWRRNRDRMRQRGLWRRQPAMELSSSFTFPDESPEKYSSIKKVDQKFQVMSGRHRMIFTAGDPQTVSFSTPTSLYRSSQGIRSSRSYGRGTSYRVTSVISKATPKQLKSASNKYPESIRMAYRDVPETCWDVRDLALRITKGEKTAYDKAAAIQGFLMSEYKYDLKAPATPHDQDAVPYFLFKSKRGYCGIFASSMVIMCRQVGIPARWVSGFSSGVYDDTDNSYHLRLRDQHAWAELYFPGYGWITFDPTPAGADTPGLGDRLLDGWEKFKLLLTTKKPAAIVAGMLLLLVVYFIKVEVIGRLRDLKRTAAGQSAARWVQSSENYRRMCELLALFGYPRHPASTPSEYAEELGQLFRAGLGHLSETVNLMTDDFLEARYAERELPDERVEVFTAALDNLRRDLKAARKHKLLPVRGK